VAIEEQEIQEDLEAAVAHIDPRFIVRLKGRPYPVFAGVLDAATRMGLKSLRVTIVQAPTSENGQMAIVTALLEMEDGRIFEDVGDCSVASTTPALAAASLRLASTRAKGRVLRDATNTGATLLEELPDASVGSAEHPARAAGNGQAAARHREQPARAAAPASARPAGANADGTVACEEAGCGVLLTKNQVTMSQHKAKRNLCPIHLGTAVNAAG
jgi:hypothetical protein